MYKMLWTGEYDEHFNEVFSKKFDIRRAGGINLSGAYGAFLTEEEVLEKIKDINILVAGYDPITKEVLKASPELKLILSGRDGPEENIDIETCTEMGIPVFSGGGRCMNGVAEITLALMFNLARPIITSSNYVRENGWTSMAEVNNFLSDASELLGKTLSIIGLGRNGKALAKIANGVGMNVIAYDPYITTEDAEKLNVKKVDLMDAMKMGDYISLLARVTPETEKMIGKEQISAMKKTACLINTGRAKLTDEDAIFEALETDQIRAAALDVYMTEPLGKEHRAYRIPAEKLILTPHIAGNTNERVAHQYENLIEGFIKFIDGDKNIYNLYNKNVFKSPEFEKRGGSFFNIPELKEELKLD